MHARFTTATALCALLAGLAMPTAAQTVTNDGTGRPGATDSPEEAGVVVEDILVTAERRESTVREVPFSIAAFGGAQLAAQQVFNPAALTQQVPGITLNTADKSLSIVAIRGNVSTFRTATLDTPVAFFQDDVYYVFNNDLNSNFYDINRVEVLRGPQGTLFGRNVVGGAIAVVTNNPAFENDYAVSGTVGNGGYLRTEGMVNAPLSDKIAARLAFSTERSDGLIKTPNQPGNYGETESYAIRGKILFQPTDTLQILVAGDYSHTKGNGGAIELGIGGPQVIPETFGEYTSEEWTNNDFARSPYAQRLRGGYIRGDLDLLGGTLTAITGYRMNDSRAINDDIPVGTVVPVFDRRQNVHNRSFTQEVRFASAPNRLSYIVGVYYLSADVSTTNTFFYSPLPGSQVGLSNRTNPDVTNITRVQEGDIKSFAVFGEATFEVTDRFALIAGGRYTKDSKDIVYRAFSTTDTGAITGFGFPGAVNASGGNDWSAFTPRFTAKWEPIDRVNLYATWARGFKSGGFVDNAYLDPTIPLDPERATNVEFGVKSRFFDNRIDFNLSVFRQKTENLQNFSGAGGIAHTYNGTLVMKGAELETVFRPVDGMRINFNYTHLDGVYTDLADPLVGLNYAGNPAKFSPKHSFTLGANYDIDLPGGGTLTPQADFNFSTRISTDDANTLRLYPNLHDATRGETLNARLNYEAPNGRWTLGVWAKNLTDNYQIVNADDITAFLVRTNPAPTTRYWKIFTNNPRTFGLTLSLRR